jgi:hypothetical protein
MDDKFQDIHVPVLFAADLKMLSLSYSFSPLLCSLSESECLTHINL